jgi:hypothetical protein
MVKRKRSVGFTDLNFTKEDLSRNSQKVIAKVGYHLLLRVKKRTAINAVWGIKILAKGQKVRSIKKVIGFKTKTMLRTVKRKAKSVRRRAKTAMSYPRSRGGTRYTNGRTFKSRRKSKSQILTAKNGRKYKILANGRARFVKN